MNLCHNRPLFSVCAAYVAAMAVGSVLTARWLGIFGGLLFVVGLLTRTVLLYRKKKRTALSAAAILLACGLAFFTCLGAFHGESTRHMDARMGQAVTVVGTVTDCRGAGGFMTSYVLDVEALDGVPTEGRFLLTCPYVSDLQPGYRVSLDTTLLTLDEAAGDGFDAATLRGDGYVAGLLSESEDGVTILAEDAGGMAVALGQCRRRLAARLEHLCGGMAAGLPSALLLGDRAALTDEVRRDFARTGVSHILSISGMHMTLLFGILGGLLRLLRFPKRLRVILLGVGALGYLALIGFLPSATRAVVMLGMVYLATLWSGRADPLTSLGVAGVLILTISPCAVYDVGFWMSMTATLGLVAYAPLFRVEAEADASVGKRLRRQGKKMVYGLLVGVVAMSCSLFLVAMAIGEVGILSPVVTLLLTPATALLLVASPLALLLIGTPLSPLLGELCALVASWMAEATGLLAEPAWVVVSLRHPAVWPVTVGMVAVAGLLLVVRLPKRFWWTTVTPLLAGWMIIGILLGVHAVRDTDSLHTTYLQPSSQADMLVMVNGRDGVICDASNGSLTAMSAAVREAEASGATEFAAILLTHYHGATSGTLSRMLARERVRALWIPVPTSPDDYYRMLSCLEVADAAEVPVTVYAPGEPLRIFEEATVTVESAMIERSAQPILLLSVVTASERLVYCGAAIFESSLANAAQAAVGKADTVVFGHHGPLTKASFGKDLAYTDHVAVILSGKGAEAGYFDPAALPPDASMWYGQRRLRLALT